MSQRTIILTLSITFSLAVIVSLYWYASAARVMVQPPEIIAVSAPEEIDQLFASRRVKGRIAVLFTRRLNSVEPNPEGTEFKYVQAAMHRGVIRKVLHVVPDSVWKEVGSNLSKKQDVRKTASGYAVLFDEGRVDVMPLSEFTRHSIREQVLTVIDPVLWSADEKNKIRRLLSDGFINFDLLLIFRGEAADIAYFK